MARLTADGDAEPSALDLEPLGERGVVVQRVAAPGCELDVDPRDPASALARGRHERRAILLDRAVDGIRISDSRRFHGIYLALARGSVPSI
jgi:hypothetical protein